MVLREVAKERPFWLKIGQKWVFVSEEALKNHPGGRVITTYANKDATQVFKMFHYGTPKAPKMLNCLKSSEVVPELVEKHREEEATQAADTNEVNMGQFEMSAEKSEEIRKEFDELVEFVENEGLMTPNHVYFVMKFISCVGMMLAAVWLQFLGFYVLSALLMGLTWQQLGWMIHEYCHHEHFKNHYLNDMIAYVVGNLLQGFSASGWKEQHNIHHAATNIVGRDGDIDLLPFWALVPDDLKFLTKQEAEKWFRILPYQHLYWAMFLPMLRVSWLVQSVQFVAAMPTHFYKCYRRRYTAEALCLTVHWLAVFYQLYVLPDFTTRIVYFLISQLFAGFLLAYVVTFNHYSVEKFHNNTSLLENYACLQLYTTRNMRSGPFTDWLWGGLNFQIEHHLFPTMPRHNLKKATVFVQKFAERHHLPYMEDDYMTGFWNTVGQLAKIARIVAEMDKS